MKIVSVGELLVDLTQMGVDERGVPIYAANPGGAPANLAVAASLSGADAAFIGKVGDDSLGNMLINTLKSKNVDISGVIKDKHRPTTLAAVSLDADGERSFSFYRSGCADASMSADELDYDLIKSADILHFGSVSLSCEPSAAATVAAVKAAKESGAIISYDPNYRPLLWNSESEAAAKMKEVLKFVDIVKVSEEELSILTDESDIRSGARKLLKSGARLAVVTLGADGAYYMSATSDGFSKGYKTETVDTNGAGDTFFGAFLSRIENFDTFLIDGKKIADALSFACAAAAYSVGKSGAIPAMPDCEQTLRFMKTYLP
ncbi:MAG: carbohydrate kinase [Acutalibacteraceae bacterium]